MFISCYRENSFYCLKTYIYFCTFKNINIFNKNVNLQKYCPYLELSFFSHCMSIKNARRVQTGK